MQIPILNGVYTDENADFRTSYPRNLVPVPKKQGISNGYLRPADGLVSRGTASGAGRGGINWNGTLYRVMGTKLVSIASDGTLTTIGEVGGSTTASMDYSFDRLAVASNNRLYYWDGATLTQVTDSDLGVVVDMIWIDGYFLTTDGEFLVVTELSDPTQINPLKYGSSESDPDPIVAVKDVRNELHAINRYTIEVFTNVGGSGFPFSVIDGARMSRGAIGTHAVDVIEGSDALVFVGSARNESPSVWIGAGGATQKIATQEIDKILKEYTESELSLSVVEVVSDESHTFVYIHLPNQTLVYDHGSSAATQEAVWFTLDSGGLTKSQYKARDFVWCYDEWNVSDPTSYTYGYTADNISSHYGADVGWEFGTLFMYNESRGAIVHELELVSLPGRVALGDDPSIWTSYSTDGEVYGQDRWIESGKIGERNKRVRWLGQGVFTDRRIQKFRGYSNCHMSFARLEARLEPLNV
jgi:hypothetical protein